MLIHAGDHTFRGTEKEVRAALEWLESLPHKYKVFIAGNHDWFFDPNAPKRFRDWSLYHFYSVQELLLKYPSLTYLKDSAVNIEGWVIYGSPWQPWFHDWAFNLPFRDIDTAEKTWAKIPDNTEILVTHAPPEGILDMGWDGRLGDHYLRNRLNHLGKLRLHVFGHIHEAAGKEEYETEDGTKLTFVNAAICTRAYEPTNLPIIIDLNR